LRELVSRLAIDAEARVKVEMRERLVYLAFLWR
jgi:hypothetical protein